MRAMLVGERSRQSSTSVIVCHRTVSLLSSNPAECSALPCNFPLLLRELLRRSEITGQHLSKVSS